KYINTIIIKNSQYSLGIYLLHPFIRDVFQILGLKSYLVVYPVTVIVVYTILIFFISLLLCKVLKKIPWIGQHLI
ncbi:MAG: hypothetical protein IJB37_04555, partial [Peptococcaceae bacterium]|nr:hypothetical protein [Peptococcaceae bacterium]